MNDPAASRADLARFLVHLTKDTPDKSALENLESIVTDRRLRASIPEQIGYGMRFERFGPSLFETYPDIHPEVVSFSETPLHGLRDLVTGSGRLSEYGVAVPMRFAESLNAQRVWYVNTWPRGVDWLSTHIERVFRAVLQGKDDEAKMSVYRIAPLLDVVGSEKSFYWEREWRYVGDFLLNRNDADVDFLLLAPESDHRQLGKHGKTVLDLRWSSDRVYEALLGAK